jgi:hypothetical protein
MQDGTDMRDGMGEERRGANLRDRFRQRLAGFVPMQWLLNTQRELERLQPQSRGDTSDVEAGTVCVLCLGEATELVRVFCSSRTPSRFGGKMHQKARGGERMHE